MGTGQNLPGPLHLGSPQEEHIAGTCNAFHSLLQLRQRDAQASSACQDQMVRLRSDLSLADAAKARLQGQLDAKEREIRSHLQKAQFAKLSHEEVALRLNGERDELQRQNSSMQRRQAQVQHDLKRKDRDYERLQDRLRDLLTEKKREAKVALEAALAIQAAAGSHARPVKAQDKAAVQAAVAGYEARQKELEQEADGLRSALHSLQQEHCALVNQHASPAATSLPQPAGNDLGRKAAARKQGALTDDPDDLMQLPKGHLQGLLGNRLAQLKRRFSVLSTDGVSAEEVKTPQEQKLMRDLVAAHTLIQEQELLVTMAMDALAREQSSPGPADAKLGGHEPPARIASPRRDQQSAREQAQKDELRVRELEAQLWVAEQKAAELEAARAAFQAQQVSYREMLIRMAPGFGAGHFLEKAVRKANQQEGSSYAKGNGSNNDLQQPQPFAHVTIRPGSQPLTSNGHVKIAVN
ncbi:hypothetical protein WJX84_003792 [Apatococcus fuscideae]|uniref:Uncharacterized protein n=1 Tax=Apatococcus fuscideae TaxID=2026836 RepID=A0AAW1T0K7_9CHLO